MQGFVERLRLQLLEANPGLQLKCSKAAGTLLDELMLASAMPHLNHVV